MIVVEPIRNSASYTRGSRYLCVCICVYVHARVEQQGTNLGERESVEIKINKSRIKFTG